MSSRNASVKSKTETEEEREERKGSSEQKRDKVKRQAPKNTGRKQIDASDFK